jgi:AbrB family looped-hinge helix DNA binding protein
MDTNELHARLTVGKKGQIVLPAGIRDALGIKPGEDVVVWVEDDRLILQTPAAVLESIRRHFAAIPADVSLVDELIAERREEARRDAAEMGIEL